jgi:hypothetical protein
VNQVDGAGNVGVEDKLCLREGFVDKRMTKATARDGEQAIHRTITDGGH